MAIIFKFILKYLKSFLSKPIIKVIIREKNDNGSKIIAGNPRTTIIESKII